MDQDSKFMQLVERVPVDNDKLIGQAVSWFIQKQSPDEVDFTKYENGYQLQVYTSGEEAQEAKEFWEAYVQPHLGGKE